MKQLLEYLKSIPKGPISDTGQLETLLAACWDEFAGGEAEKMAGDKLYKRMDDVQWDSPVLTFVIERHGGTILGSTRAERHMWTLNVDSRIASYQPMGYRQVQPMQPRLDISPEAKEIAQLIINHKEDERLKWKRDGSVHVRIGKIIPAGSAVEQTLHGRRRRFRQAVGELLRNQGWQETSPNVYAPPAA